MNKEPNAPVSADEIPQDFAPLFRFDELEPSALRGAAERLAARAIREMNGRLRARAFALAGAAVDFADEFLNPRDGD